MLLMLTKVRCGSNPEPTRPPTWSSIWAVLERSAVVPPHNKEATKMTYQCPKGHTSTDADYCSECGALIGQTSVKKVEMTAAAVTLSADICPDCATLRTGGSRF